MFFNDTESSKRTLLTHICQQDHAPSAILIEEAGGVITDADGEPLNFGLGRSLENNYGIIAAGKDVHSRVLKAVKQVRAEGK